jgi:hypothetical protein
MSDAGTSRTQELQRLWGSLVKIFPSWSLPLDMFFSPSSWRMVGVDMIASQVHDRRVRRAATVLQGVPEEMLVSLMQMARLNEERATNLFRAVAVCYITLPIALGAFLSDAAPDQVNAYLDTNLDSIGPAIVALVVTPIIYFFGMWRSKQIAWAIELHRAGGVAPLPPKKNASQARARA